MNTGQVTFRLLNIYRKQAFDMTRQNGFTILELMTTLAVAAILASVAVPGLQSITANSRQSGSVNELVSAIHLARNSAVTRNTRITVCASSNGQTCEAVDWNEGWIVFDDPDDDQTVDAAETVLNSGANFENLTISSPEFANAFTYRANGRLTNAAAGTIVGQFNLCDHRGAGYAKVLVVEISGRPRIAEHGEIAAVCP